MLILTIRTDKPESEIGLFAASKKLSYKTWLAHRQLSETIHKTIETLLEQHNKTWQDIEGIVFYKGPGSFTGLRIGASVANALAGDQSIPIVTATGEDWIQQGVASLLAGQNEAIALPYYGEASITTPQKK